MCLWWRRWHRLSSWAYEFEIQKPGDLIQRLISSSLPFNLFASDSNNMSITFKLFLALFGMHYACMLAQLHSLLKLDTFLFDLKDFIISIRMFLLIF